MGSNPLCFVITIEKHSINGVPCFSFYLMEISWHVEDGDAIRRIDDQEKNMNVLCSQKWFLSIWCSLKKVLKFVRLPFMIRNSSTRISNLCIWSVVSVTATEEEMWWSPIGTKNDKKMCCMWSEHAVWWIMRHKIVKYDYDQKAFIRKRFWIGKCIKKRNLK